jgi:hypothetical protein
MLLSLPRDCLHKKIQKRQEAYSLIATLLTISTIKSSMCLRKLRVRQTDINLLLVVTRLTDTEKQKKLFLESQNQSNMIVLLMEVMVFTCLELYVKSRLDMLMLRIITPELLKPTQLYGQLTKN